MSNKNKFIRKIEVGVDELGNPNEYHIQIEKGNIIISDDCDPITHHTNIKEWGEFSDKISQLINEYNKSK